MQECNCDKCKLYKKHAKNLEIIERYSAKLKKLEKEIEIQKDYFWNNFLNHRAALIDMGYLKDDYPTERGVTVSQIRAENELYYAEIFFSNVLEGLSPAELASVICSVATEEMRMDNYAQIPLSPNVRKTLNLIRNIRKKVDRVQKNNNVEEPMYINSFYAPLIEMWVNGAEWDSLIEEVDIGEGDIVRVFKRTVDVLRQLCTIDNIPDWLVFTAREAIDSIQREPINID